MMNDIRPRNHLTVASKLYPGAWRQYDAFRQDRGNGLPEWPDYVYCPLAAAYAIISGGGENRVPHHLADDIGRLGALAAWRVTQGVYRFDADLYAAVVDTPIDGNLPCAVLKHLPEWCVYIETPGLWYANTPLYGFFAHIEWDVGTGREELRLVLDAEADLQPVALHMGSWPLSDAIERMIAEASRQAVYHGAGRSAAALSENKASAAVSIAKIVEPLVSLLLYLCAENAEIGDGSRRPGNPQPKRTKNGWRLFAPDRPTDWDVGVRLGAALRRAQQGATGEFASDGGHHRLRAHIRRAHWHTFLVGAGRTERRLKWMPPIPINASLGDDLPTTIRPVE